jgi:Polyketide cyclase / dehydrase and lipid transport
MKVTSRHDIDAPVDFVFRTLVDFDAWERSAMRRGADVVRTDKMTTVAPGLSWLVRFRFRGKERKLAIRLTGIDPGARAAFAVEGGLFEATSIVDLMELGPNRTRFVMVGEAKPKSLGARLILQSLRLARARVQRNLDRRVMTISEEIGNRYRATHRPAAMGLR